MHKTKAGSSNILYSNSCVLEAEQRNETKRYATHKHTHAHTATATATERERKRHHCMLYAICAIADYRRRESKRHLFVVDSLDKHSCNAIVSLGHLGYLTLPIHSKKYFKI